MLKEVNELRRNSVDVIQLSTGQPSLPLDEEVLNFLISKLRENPLKVSSYSPTAGIPELREKNLSRFIIFRKNRC